MNWQTQRRIQRETERDKKESERQVKRQGASRWQGEKDEWRRPTQKETEINELERGERQEEKIRVLHRRRPEERD